MGAAIYEGFRRQHYIVPMSGLEDAVRTILIMANMRQRMMSPYFMNVSSFYQTLDSLASLGLGGYSSAFAPRSYQRPQWYSPLQQRTFRVYVFYSPRWESSFDSDRPQRQHTGDEYTSSQSKPTGTSRPSEQKTAPHEPAPLKASFETLEFLKKHLPAQAHSKINLNDYYSILGLPRTATEREVETAYRRLSLKVHPDKNGNSPVSTEAFRLINEAKKKILNTP